MLSGDGFLHAHDVTVRSALTSHRVSARPHVTRSATPDVTHSSYLCFPRARSGPRALPAGLNSSDLAGPHRRRKAGAVFGRQTSQRTLHSRITTNYLWGSIRGSTFGFTIASVLAPSLGLTTADHRRLTREAEETVSGWMSTHLDLVTVAVEATVRDDVETAVLHELDPPLRSLHKTQPSPLRTALKGLRRGPARRSNEGSSCSNVARVASSE